MNELVNDGIKLSKLKINTGFINGLPKKWLSFCQSLINTNNTKDFELASLFDSPDDEEDTRNSHKYLNDLKEEYQARALLAKSKKFFKKVTQRSYREAYECDVKKIVSSDDNEMVEVKVLMALAEENDAASKEGAKNSEWVKITIRKVHTLLEMEDNDDRNVCLDYLCIDLNYVEEQRRFFFLPMESQRNTTDPPVAVTDSPETDYDSADDFSISPAKGNKSTSASKVISAPAVDAQGHMMVSKSYQHKYVEQPGPKEVFGDDSTCTTEGYGFIKCNGIVFTKFDEKRGTIFNSNKEIVMMSPRVRDVYVLDMTSFAQESCFFTMLLKIFQLALGIIGSCSSKLHKYNQKTSYKQNIVIGLPSPLSTEKINHCSHVKGKTFIGDSFKTKTVIFYQETCLLLLHMDFLDLTGNGTEFRNNTLVNFCDEKGISQNFSSPYTHEQNGVAERKNRTLIEAARTMLLGSIFSKQYWTEAVAIACYTPNRSTIVKKHLKTPYEIFAIKFLEPSVDNINIVESERYPPDEYLHPYEPSQRYQTNSNDVSFIEPYEYPEPVVLETEVSSDQNDQPVQNDEILNDDHSELSNHTYDEQIIDTHECLFINFFSEEEPKKVSEALKHPGWVDAMQDELNQFARNKVWTLVPVPYGKTIIGLRWVFMNKRDETGIVIHAR
ncbi:retrovirus-related pol polyprotein from transposon TNT 1-94 [Tanacetum coccineum]